MNGTISSSNKSKRDSIGYPERLSIHLHRVNLDKTFQFGFIAINCSRHWYQLFVLLTRSSPEKRI
jgi:hypothetical protein